VDTAQEDGFVVFVRMERSPIGSPESAEQELYHCSTYAEARLLRRKHQGAARECIVRYVGSTGGGD